MEPKLDARLSAAAELLRPGTAVADVGCDHGKLTAVLAAQGHRVIGTDLRPGPLEKARATLDPGFWTGPSCGWATVSQCSCPVRCRTS